LTWQQLAGVSTLPLREPSATVPSSHHSIKHACPTAIHPAVNFEPQEPELPQESSTKPQASNLSTVVNSKGRVQWLDWDLFALLDQDLFSQLDQDLFAQLDWDLFAQLDRDLFAQLDRDLFAQSDRDLSAQSDQDLTLVKVISDSVLGESKVHTAQLAIQDRMPHPVAFDVNCVILNKNLLLAADCYSQEMHASVPNTECSHLPILPDSNKVITVGKQSSEGASTGSNTVITKHDCLEVFEGVPVQDSVHTIRRTKPVRPTLSIFTAAKPGQFALDLDDHIYIKSTQVKLFTLTDATLILKLKHYQLVTVSIARFLSSRKIST
jgi:hypothetical protein